MYICISQLRIIMPGAHWPVARHLEIIFCPGMCVFAPKVINYIHMILFVRVHVCVTFVLNFTICSTNNV